MEYLPILIILECIFPKLPVKSLIRFKCVSKFFLTEISSPRFIEQYHRKAISSNANRLLIIPKYNEGVYVYDLDSPHCQPSYCPYPQDLFLFAPFMSVVATCESYLLIGCGYTQLDDLFMLNPSTRTYRKVCHQPVLTMSGTVLYGMWHSPDELYDEYRVVRFVHLDGTGSLNFEVMVYSMTTNTWKEIERIAAIDTFVTGSNDNTPVLVQNHLIHLFFFKLSQNFGSQTLTRMRCFDMKAERWANDVPLPDFLWDENGFDLSPHNDWSLGELDDQLCLKGYKDNESIFELWVMKEYAVKESWVKLISLCVSSVLDSPSYCPFAYRTWSPHELFYIQGGSNTKLYWYNLKDKKAIEAEIPIADDEGHYWDRSAYICKGSLLNFPGGQPIQISSKEENGDEDEEWNDNSDDEDFVI